MLTIYLDGIELHGNRKKFVVNIMGPQNHSCNYCDGSFVKVRRILIYSDGSPVVFFYWCASCGKINRITEEFPTSGTNGSKERLYHYQTNQFIGRWDTESHKFIVIFLFWTISRPSRLFSSGFL